MSRKSAHSCGIHNLWVVVPHASIDASEHRLIEAVLVVKVQVSILAPLWATHTKRLLLSLLFSWLSTYGRSDNDQDAKP